MIGFTQNRRREVTCDERLSDLNVLLVLEGKFDWYRRMFARMMLQLCSGCRRKRGDDIKEIG